MHVLAEFLYWWGLLEVGLAMIDGSYYREGSVYDERNFPEPKFGSDDVG
jgi:hypothetical protein